MAEKLVTTVHLSREETDALRELAARLGLMYTTGPIAGKMGNPRALFGLIADAYNRNPDKMYMFLASLKDREK